MLLWQVYELKQLSVHLCNYWIRMLRLLSVVTVRIWICLTKWSPDIRLCLFVPLFVCVGWLESRQAVCHCVGGSLLNPPLCCLGYIVWQRETERCLEFMLHLQAWILNPQLEPYIWVVTGPLLREVSETLSAFMILCPNEAIVQCKKQ